MQIIWHGLSCFQLVVTRAKGEHVTILIDPLDEEATGLRIPRSNADIVIFTNHQYTTANQKKMGAQEGAFIIDGPGEYEVKGVYIQGVASVAAEASGDEPAGKASRKAAATKPKKEEYPSNTIYSIEAEEMQACALGNLRQAELTDDQIEKIGAVDILMCPVGNGSAIDAKEALKVMSQIEPSIVIPANYQIPKQKIKLGTLQEFLKAAGVGPVEAQPKLVVKKKDISPQEAKIIVLNP